MIDHIESAMEDRWKSMEMFEDFKDTLDTLSEDETKIQEEKVKQFLRIVAVSLTKHFGMWVSKDLFFFLYFQNQSQQNALHVTS